MLLVVRDAERSSDRRKDSKLTVGGNIAVIVDRAKILRRELVELFPVQ